MKWYGNKPLVIHRPDSVFCELAVDEWEQSGLMAVRRVAQSERSGLQERYGATRDMVHEICSMHAENAVQIILGEKWHQHDRDATERIVNPKGPDVGNVQVRQAAGGRNNSLIVRPNDADSAVFLLVLGWHRLYELTGWFRGSEAKQEAYKCAPDPSRPAAWMVPCSKLHPVSTLPGIDKELGNRFVNSRTRDMVLSK